MTARDLSGEQRRVARGMAGALLTAIGVLATVAFMDRQAATPPFANRLQFAVRADLFVAIWLGAAIANVARLRFFSARDIAADPATPPSDNVRAARAMLQNTTEQVGLAIVTHLIVAATFDRSNALVVALVCLFTVGRALFWAGYRHGASRRAFGFALTFYPSLLALLASAVALPFTR